MKRSSLKVILAMLPFAALIVACQPAPIEGVWTSTDSNIQAYYGDNLLVIKTGEDSYTAQDFMIAPDKVPFLETEGSVNSNKETVKRLGSGWGFLKQSAAGSVEVILSKSGDILTLKQTTTFAAQKNMLTKKYKLSTSVKQADIKPVSLKGLWVIEKTDAEFGNPLVMEKKAGISFSDDGKTAFAVIGIADNSLKFVGDACTVSVDPLSGSLDINDFCYFKEPTTGSLSISKIYPNELEGKIQMSRGYMPLGPLGGWSIVFKKL